MKDLVEYRQLKSRDDKMTQLKTMFTNVYPVNQNAVEKMVEMLELKGYSNSTIKTCRNEFMQFLTALKNNSVDSCDFQEVRSYMLYCYKHLNLTENTLHSFEGQDGGQYSIRSTQQVFKSALQKAGINKKVGIHSLRHSYATHLLEQGTDIRFIQELLGHKDLKTTLIYTDVTNNSIRNITSPLDKL